MTIRIAYERGNSEVWYVGEKAPSSAAVLQVVADGKELEYLREKFVGIRMYRGNVVVWRDDDAQFIVDNLAANT